MFYGLGSTGNHYSLSAFFFFLFFARVDGQILHLYVHTAHVVEFVSVFAGSASDDDSHSCTFSRG